MEPVNEGPVVVTISLEQQVNLLTLNVVRLIRLMAHLESENGKLKADLVASTTKINSLVDQLNSLAQLNGYDYDETSSQWKVI